MIEYVLSQIDQSADEIVQFTQRLVQIPSENVPPVGFEQECQEYLIDFLKNIGVEIDSFLPTDVEGITEHPAFLAGRNYENRPNVVGVWKGEGGGKSLIISGHMDTSPKEPMPWGKYGPFSGEVSEGKIYGRGTFDMKGGLAAGFMAVKFLKESGIKLKGDVILESVVDEEYGGANGTLATILRGYTADAAIVPEPTEMVICPATRGDQNFKVTIQGNAGMPYTSGEWINPVYGMASIIKGLRRFEKMRFESSKIHPLYENVPNPLPVIIKKLKAGEIEEHGALGIPIDCWLLVGIQTFPPTTEEEVDNQFFSFMDSLIESDAELKKNPPNYEKRFRYVEPTEISISHPIVGEIKDSFRQITGREGDVKGAPFPCDAFMFNKFGNTPVVCFGPKGGNAHAPNEFVYIKDLVDLTKIFVLIIFNWCNQTFL
ncbi:M20/M25/M40 family metallo-hydrolase [bacterium]|nr:M20/M25/M40 family metallo-hydrolase [bacterium]